MSESEKKLSREKIRKSIGIATYSFIGIHPLVIVQAIE
jgi:hypothetical protein